MPKYKIVLEVSTMILLDIFTESGFRSLYEAILHFSKEDFQNQPDDFVNIWMDDKGNVNLGYSPKGNFVSATLFPKTKEISIRGNALPAAVGNRINPLVQQLVATLRQQSFIDETWKIETSSGIGYYKKGSSTYIKEPEPVDKNGIDYAADPKNRFSMANLDDLIFYHGTSSVDWVKIQKYGLVPLMTGPNTTGASESRAKYDMNAHVLYLATTTKIAHGYAKARTESWERKFKKETNWKALDQVEEVIIEVRVPDPTRLVSDDDAVNDVMRSIATKTFKNKSPDEQKRIMTALSASAGFEIKDRTVAEMLWRETKEGFDEIIEQAPKEIWKDWFKSLQQYNQVGYRGIIPPTFLKRIL